MANGDPDDDNVQDNEPEGPEPLGCLAFARDCKTLAAVTRTGRVHVWGADDEEEVHAYFRRAATAHPEQTESQLDLARSCWGLASRLGQSGPAGNKQSRRLLQEGLEILRQLQKKKKLAPGEQRWLGEFE